MRNNYWASTATSPRPMEDSDNLNIIDDFVENDEARTRHDEFMRAGHL